MSDKPTIGEIRKRLRSRAQRIAAEEAHARRLARERLQRLGLADKPTIGAYRSR